MYQGTFIDILGKKFEDAPAMKKWFRELYIEMHSDKNFHKQCLWDVSRKKEKKLFEFNSNETLYRIL